MTDFASITDTELAQARSDPAFRQRLLAEHLEHLLAALNFLRSTDTGGDPIKARQIRDGVTLAMRLSDILHRLGGGTGAAAGFGPS